MPAKFSRYRRQSKKNSCATKNGDGVRKRGSPNSAEENMRKSEVLETFNVGPKGGIYLAGSKRSVSLEHARSKLTRTDFGALVTVLERYAAGKGTGHGERKEERTSPTHRTETVVRNAASEEAHVHESRPKRGVRAKERNTPAVTPRPKAKHTEKESTLDVTGSERESGETKTDSNGVLTVVRERQTLNPDKEMLLEREISKLENKSAVESTLSLAHIKRVLGPHQLVVQTLASLQLRFFTWGELHYGGVACPMDVTHYERASFAQFTRALVAAFPEQQFDLFLEARYHVKGQAAPVRELKWPREEGELVQYYTLSHVWDDFRHCLVPTKTECHEAANLRVHYVDTRVIFASWNRAGQDYVSDTARHLDLLDDVHQLVNDVWETGSRLLGPKKMRAISSLAQLIVTVIKLETQIVHIRFPHVVARLRAMWTNKVAHTCDVLDRMRTTSVADILKEPDIWRVTAACREFVYTTWVSVMDVYTLARMFRCYGRGGATSLNLMFYGGSAHSDVYTQFINDCSEDSTTIFSAVQPSTYDTNKCLDVTLANWTAIMKPLVTDARLPPPCP
jgi:hypothetical protein